jgi:hypothetical protein
MNVKYLLGVLLLTSLCPFEFRFQGLLVLVGMLLLYVAIQTLWVVQNRTTWAFDFCVSALFRSIAKSKVGLDLGDIPATTRALPTPA